MKFSIGDFHSRPHQPGECGALLDLYAEAAVRLCDFVASVSEEDWQRELPANDADGGSVSNLLGHVIWAARHYVDIARSAWDGSEIGEPSEEDSRYANKPASVSELQEQLTHAIGDMADFLWSLDEENYQEFRARPIPTGTGLSINLGLLLQHAICHLDRHRRQIGRKLDGVR